MKVSHATIQALLAGLALCVMLAAAAEPGGAGEAALREISVCGDAWPPFTDPEDPRKGICFALTGAIFRSQGVAVDKLFLPPARTIRALVNLEVDAACQFWRTPERAEVLLFSEPYLYNEVVFFVPADSGVEYRSLRDLEGYTIGVVRDYYNGEAFEAADHLDKYVCDTSQQVLGMLARGRLDMGVCDRIVGRTIIKRLGLEGRLKTLPKPLFRAGLHLVAGKRHPRGEAIIRTFNAGLEAIRRSGEYRRILESYGVKKVMLEPDAAGAAPD
jgi:ABC-type amino acid transport substrate-binding protein